MTLTWHATSSPIEVKSKTSQETQITHHNNKHKCNNNNTHPQWQKQQKYTQPYQQYGRQQAQQPYQQYGKQQTQHPYQQYGQQQTQQIYQQQTQKQQKQTQRQQN